MTDGLSYNMGGYRNMVRMSAFKYILVEGKDDKRSLKYLINDILEKQPDIKIHGAHQISSDKALGNREKVEEISKSISSKKYAKRFAGFVDREFREFELSDDIDDLIKRHKVIDRLIWSRGHSIENYFFDFIVLQKPLRHNSTTEFFDDALDLFEQNLENTLKLACAATLAGWKCGLLGAIKRSMDWNILEFNADNLIINKTKWIECLVNRQKIGIENANTLMNMFDVWHAKIYKVDFNIIRWLCHGHIGLSFIWASYARCVFEVSQKSGCEDPYREARNVLKADETVRFNNCASEWAECALNKLCEYPTELFTILGFSNPNLNRSASNQ